MDDDLKLLLEQFNQNLNTIIRNQVLVYEKLGQMEKMMRAEKQA